MKILPAFLSSSLFVLLFVGGGFLVQPSTAKAQCTYYDYDWYIDGETGAITHSMYQYAHINPAGQGCQEGGGITAPTAALTASPTTIVQGSSALLSWASANANTCVGTNFATASSTSGAIIVSPTTTTTYKVTCKKLLSAVATATVTVLPPAPTVTLSANPTSIVSGNSSTLTWSSTNATSCTGDANLNTGGATSGSGTSWPGASTTYSISCTGPGGTKSASTSVTVSSAPDGSCSVSPTSAAIGANVTWTAAPSGGNGTYTYSWTGTDSLSGTSASVVKSYSTSGTKTGSVTITSGGVSVVKSCSNSTSVGPTQCADGIDNDGNGTKDYPADTGCSSAADNTESGGAAASVSCTVTPTTVATGGSATYTATPANGATGAYAWTASDGATGLGTGVTATRTFPALGLYGMTVKGSNTSAVSCPQVNTNSCSGTKTATLDATPTRVNSGSTAVLNWNAQNITTSCVITGPGVSQTIPAASCTIPTTSSFTTPAITTQSVYSITCDGTLLDTAIVNVVPKIEEF